MSFSSLGFILLPVRWASAGSVAKLLLSSVLICLCIYKFILSDPYLYTLHIKDFTSKPFLQLLIHFNATLNYQVTYLFTLAYYLAYMPAILQLLDSPLFALTFKRFSAPRSRAVAVVLLFKTFYLITYFDVLWEYYTTTSSLQFAFSWLTLYVHYLIISLPLAVGHYIQLGTWQAVKSIVGEESGGYRIKTMSGLLQRVKAVAKLNSTLQRLNSPPLLLYLVSNTIDELSIICRLSLSRSALTSPSLFFFVGMFGYQLYLAYLSAQTATALKQTAVQLYCCSSQRNQSKPTKTQSDLQHLLTFERQLSVTIFSFIRYSYAFVFGLALFLLQYSVFLLQTKQES